MLGALEATGLINYIPKLNRISLEAKVKKTIAILREFGIEPNENKALIKSSKISQHNGDIKGLISNCTISKPVSVGKTEAVTTESFWDVIGDSTNEKKAILYARALTTKYKDLLRKNLMSDFDFVVTPKNGSPILGYEFSRILKKDFALHSSDEKYFLSNGDVEWHQYFDMHPKPKQGATALIVDDSTTGGRKIMEIIDHLRHFGYKVNNCLVIFEPQIKKPLPSEKFSEMKVKLHYIEKKGRL